MHTTAAYLVDHLLPDVPHRQWVLSLPRWVRCKLAYQPGLVSKVLRIFLRAIFAWQRLRARRCGVPDGKPGAVTFVQRFGSALDLNVHFHALLPDGVFVEREDGMGFVEIEPMDEEVQAITMKVVRRILRLIEFEATEENAHALATDQADPYAGAAEMQRSQPLKDDEPIMKPGRRAFYVDGFSVHANVSINEGKRDALERLARYGARPPVALGRLRQAEDGRLSYRLKHRAPGVAECMLLTPLELLGKLAALIPPPRADMVRYHGCFAPNAKCRSKVIPRTTKVETPPVSTEAVVSERAEIIAELARPGRLDWAALLKRVFAVDVLECEECGGPMRVLAFLTDTEVTEHILNHLGLPTAPPALAPARDPPEAEGAKRDEPGTEAPTPDYDGVDFIPADLD